MNRKPSSHLWNKIYFIISFCLSGVWIKFKLLTHRITSSFISYHVVSYHIAKRQLSRMRKNFKDKVLLLLLKKSGVAGGKLLPPWALYYWRPFYKLSQVSQKRIPMGLLISELMSFIYSQFKLKKTIKKQLKSY